MKTNTGFEIDVTDISLGLLKSINSTMNHSFHLHSHILYDLRTMLNKDEATYLEIGGWVGSSASLMVSHPQKTNVISVDLWDLNKQHIVKLDTFKNNVKRFNKNNYPVYTIIGDSSNQKCIDGVRNITDKVDILFIDGDHSFSGCFNDFINYKDFVVSGGYVVFDDYRDYQHSPHVKHAVDYILDSNMANEFEIIGFTKSTFETKKPFKSFSNEFILKKR
jgi:predicted O-methyltransferase YrrM